MYIPIGVAQFALIVLLASPGSSAKLDCRTCRTTVEAFLDNLTGSRANRKDSSQDLAALKKKSCLSLDSDQHKDQCINFLEHHNRLIEEWMHQQRHKNVRMFDFVCVSRLKLCCATNKFGPNCRDCPSCPPNRQCDGEGTREGNGTCVCRHGHTGEDCSKCLPGYYKSSTSDTIVSTNCYKCHKSCKFCRAEGPKGCEVCQSGYHWVNDLGCVDIDECIQGNRDICGRNTFCVNTEGSYFCYECDRACDGCHGDGPDMCLRCGKNYFSDKGTCTAKRPTVIQPESNYYRYAIYLGMCICTCIILHNNILIASLVGMAVALYVGLSEYTLSTGLNPNNLNDFSINTAKDF